MGKPAVVTPAPRNAKLAYFTPDSRLQVRWSCEKDDKAQYVNATLIQHECNLPKLGCHDDMSGALKKVMDCDGK